ncbi:MAG: serine hydrolase domain-containing protein [Cyclobacteriaceae bacterium]
MKNLLPLLAAIILVSCESQTPIGASQPAVRKMSSDYVVSSFSKDDRVVQIATIRERLHELFVNYAEEKNIPGISYGIVVDNQLVIDSAVGVINIAQQLPATPESSFRIASMTKSFTAMAIMKLVENGQLGLHDPVSNYLPEMAGMEYPTTDAPTITVEHLLTMTAGFPEDNPWGDRQLEEPEEMLRNLMKENISFSNPPGHAYEYSNTGYAMLGMIVSKVSGEPYQQYITKNILEPLGMNATYWEVDDVPEDQLVIGYRPKTLELEPMLHHGVYGAMGGLITSIDDFSKYVSFHLSAWPPRGDAEEGPVRRSSLRKMHQPQYQRLISSATDWNDEPCPVISGYGYGLGTSENCEGTRRVSHGGALPGFGSYYVFYPKLGIGIMAFCNLTYTSAWPSQEILKLLFDELDLKPRQTGTSEILVQRRDQIVEMITTWDTNLEELILAENFYLDEPRDNRMKAINELLRQSGEILEIGDIKPRNQLRGSFDIYTATDTLDVFFTLSPEADPKIQRLDIRH